jgi:hypothetical protein
MAGRARQDIVSLGDARGADAFPALEAFPYRMLAWMPFTFHLIHSRVIANICVCDAFAQKRR